MLFVFRVGCELVRADRPTDVAVAVEDDLVAVDDQACCVELVDVRVVWVENDRPYAKVDFFILKEARDVLSVV